jgi:hypothetical protein
MGFLDKIFGGGAKALIGTVGQVVDKFVTTDAERAAAKLEMEKVINSHIEKMAELAIRENEVENADRDSARKREEAYIKSTGRADWFQHFVGAVVLICFVAVTVFLLNREVPERNNHIVVNLIGILEGAVIGIITYFYGSSRGSRIKDTKP